MTQLFPSIFGGVPAAADAPLLGTLRNGAAWWSLVHWTRAHSGALVKLDTTLLYKSYDDAVAGTEPDTGEFSLRYFPTRNQLAVESASLDEQQQPRRSALEHDDEFAEIERVYKEMIKQFGHRT